MAQEQRGSWQRAWWWFVGFLAGCLKAWHWSWKAAARTAVTVGLAYATYSGLRAGDVWMSMVGLAGLLLLGFWPYIDRIIRTRDITIGREGISLTRPKDAPSPPDDGEVVGRRIEQYVGEVRDSFIYLGNHFLRTARGRFGMVPMQREAEDWVWLTAYEHFAAANRLTNSILTAFRCMQCLAGAEHVPAAEDLLIRYYEQALRHAEGPREQWAGREIFAEWVRKHRASLPEPDFGSRLRRDLRAVEF